jgi:CubicO group peptidase (beta-lactamase class C family)
LQAHRRGLRFPDGRPVDKRARANVEPSPRALNYTPAEAYSYTNSGYNLLAIIVDRVSGQPFAEFSRQRIFQPLGLADTQWRDDYRRVVPGRSASYAFRDDEGILDRPGPRNGPAG